MKRRDPVTGDQLSAGEYLSWLIQSMIRRWAFLGLITLLTVIVWTTNNPIALNWWNLGASYMALVIESVVGISMYAQTRRDALVMRETRKISQQNAQQLARLEAVEEKMLLILQNQQEITERL
ncbi:hypothetical protein EPA93_09270 [Ktedonosporobacter rubrisoli]|uniref:DUF1003 domain-containing protein n=1 Tax=Ktedonosporobacter rubrisoli TaxID=2509675 RepID=A0A4P6JLS6_KTERU|nr:hypothetical protein [Ktedonosporobacter rubrisoli]QBD76189.1 hypothetical protein EPA93_09270 [Ktedonosporobacter rubrisoli]